jgi:hypothetical protein
MALRRHRGRGRRPTNGTGLAVERVAVVLDERVGSREREHVVPVTLAAMLEKDPNGHRPRLILFTPYSQTTARVRALRELSAAVRKVGRVKRR